MNDENVGKEKVSEIPPAAAEGPRYLGGGKYDPGVHEPPPDMPVPGQPAFVAAEPRTSDPLEVMVKNPSGYGTNAILAARILALEKRVSELAAKVEGALGL